MKQLFLFIAFWPVAVLLQAQDATVVTPAAYLTTLNNYVRTWDAVKPDTTEADFTISSGLQHSRITTVYYDGLGRPLQSVVKGGSMITGSAAADMVTATVYDEAGRSLRNFLPFTANTTGGNTSVSDGAFKQNPFQQQQWFYSNSNTNSPVYGQGETFYYGKAEYDNSPLNRVLRTYSAGNNWMVGARGTITQYLTNTAADSVRFWDVANGSPWGSYSSPFVYTAGELNKTIVTDEHGKQVVTFTDRNGHTVLKKVQLTSLGDNGTGSGHTGWLCTYYVYDILDQLRAVIQPEGVKTLAGTGWFFTTTLYNEQCFRYEYDGRRRMSLKKVPGAAEVELVYDARDRLVLTRDGNLRAAGQWLVTRYDEINRPIQTWLWTNSDTRSTQQAAATSSTDYPGTGVLTDLQTETYYDNYSWSGNPFGTTRNTVEGAGTPSNTVFPYPQDAATQSSLIKGLVTGTKVKVLGSSTYLYSINFYDDKSRVIQTVSTNITGSMDVVNTQYTFTGQVYVVVNRQVKGGTNAQTTVTNTNYVYDDLLRLLKVTKIARNALVNSGAWGSTVTLSDQSYDAVGHVKTKKLGQKKDASGNYTTTPVETLNYDYNIRGWLLGMNKNYLSSASITANYFGFELDYDKDGYALNYSKQYNGNIGQAIWRSQGDGEKRKFEYGYDAANRLLRGDFSQYTTSSSSWTNATVNFNFKMGFGIDPDQAYDYNGNIIRMQQWGLKNGASTQIDHIAYTYYPGSNKLKNVIDGNNNPNTALGDFRTSTTYLSALGGSKTNAATDYTYDDNGNLLKDLNKDIGTSGASGITYNYLNLPQAIVVTNKGTISYTYDATGRKLSKVVSETGKASITTLYINANTFINDELQSIGTEEGRITFTAAAGSTAAKLNYDYFIKDHLGNIRMVLTEGSRVDTYPAATMETAAGTTETAFYSNISNTRTAKPGSYPTDTYTSSNDMVAKLNGSGNKIGPAIALRVMAGDAFTCRVSSYWANSMFNSPVSPLTDLITAMSSSIGAVSNKAGVAELAGSSAFSSQISGFLGSRSNNLISPKAYIQWVMFDEQFNYVSASSGALQVNSPDVLNVLMPSSAISITKNGYLYVYVSNETPGIDVYFDNLQVTHVHGNILEETHYYPFGLAMAGISSSALNFSKENRLKYNGKELQNKEFSDGSGLDVYDYGARMQSCQLGRFMQVDPKCELYPHYNTYNYCFNNPILLVDPDGMSAKYNWEEGKYYDGDREVSWEDVQQQYQIGEFSKFSSVLLAPEYENDGSTIKKDYGTGALTNVVEAAKRTGGNIKVLNVKDAEDAADQLEKIDKKISNLFILSHGDAKDAPGHKAYFAIGEQNFNNIPAIRRSSALSRIAMVLESTPGPLPSAAQVIVFACGAGGVHNGGVELMKALAKKLNATVYANQSLSAASSGVFNGRSASFSQENWPADHSTAPGHYSNAYYNTGRWTRAFEYGAIQVSQTITNVSFDSFGKIHYTF